MRKCSVCGKSKPAEQFPKDRRANDGLQAKCKECKRRYNEAWRAANRDKAAQSARRWRLKNRDKHNRTNREWKKKNPSKVREYAAQQRESHPDRIAARNAVTKAVRCGRIMQLPCLVCGDMASQAHHSSYDESMRLAVTWLCREHHTQAHMINGGEDE